MRLPKYVALLVSAFFVHIAPAGAAISFIEPLATPLVSVRNGNGPVGLATGDFNGDGKRDLAVTLFDDFGVVGPQGFVALMLGNGDGTFQAPTTLVTLAANVFARGILAKDVDGDTKLDLLVAVGEAQQILFFKGHGDGTFDTPVPIATTHRPHGLQGADLNGDGRLDLVTVNSFDNTVSVLLGNGNGTFQSPTNYAVGGSPQDVAIGEVDGRNDRDLVVGSFDTSTIGVLLNNGNGTFGPVTSFSAGVQVFGLYLADFDADGKADVVAAGISCSGGNINGGGCLVFMKGQGNGSFTVPSAQNFTGLDSTPTRRFTENVATDVNGDGKPDVLFVHSQGGGISASVVYVGLGRGDGTFDGSFWVGSPPQPDLNADPDFVTGLAAVAADFTGGGVLDLAYATVGKDNTRGGVSILPGDTPGTFKVPRSYQANYNGFTFGPPERGGVFGDFTGDGDVDLAVLAGRTDIFVTSDIIDVFAGNGVGSLGDAITGAPWPPSGAQFHHTLRSADLDQNGTLDLVFFHSDQNLGQVASGNGNGTLTLFSTFGLAAGGPLNMVLADFNGDGFPDVAAFEGTGCFFPNAVTSIEILLQGAGGTKTFTGTSPLLPVNGVCGGGTALVAADFDKDTKVDLVVPLGTSTDGSNASALFFKGNGNGTFQAATVVGTGLATISEYVAVDVDDDGNLDLIGIGGGAVYVQLGNGNGSFEPPVAYQAGVSGCGQQCGVRVADFDGDGILDIAVVGSNAFSGFAVLRGMGDGAFEAPVKFAVGATGTVWLDVADVNGDGKPDVVVGHGGLNGNGYTVVINNTPSVPPPSADLRLTKTDSPDPVTVGGNLTYTITVLNNGPGAATGVTVNDLLPAGVTFVSATASQGSCSGTTTISCSLGSLASGGSATVTIVVTPTAAGQVSNTASVTGQGTDPNPANNSATQLTTVSGAAASDLVLSKADAPDPVAAGANITYSLGSSNVGTAVATNVVLTDSTPANTTFQSVTAPRGWACTKPTVGGTGLVRCTTATFGPGASAALTLVVKVNPGISGGTVISNTASISAAGSDPTPANNSATTTTTVAGGGGGPTISIADAQTVEKRGDLVFTITLSAPSTLTVTVTATTANNTAIAPGDYQAKTATVTFPPGQTSQPFAVRINDDTLVEGTETFFVNLSNAVNATIADGQAVGTILDND